MVDFRSLLERMKISGGRKHRFAEAVQIDRSKVLDFSDSKENNISTSVDCYVSGHYVDGKGNVLEVKQRYTVFLAYSGSSLQLAMGSLKQRILDDFQNKYPGMNIDEVFIPKMIAPIGDEGVTEDLTFYFGSQMFRTLTKAQQRSDKLGSASDMYKRNVDTIKRRFGL
jgi:hypothetical protein